MSRGRSKKKSFHGSKRKQRTHFRRSEIYDLLNPVLYLHSEKNPLTYQHTHNRRMERYDRYGRQTPDLLSNHGSLHKSRKKTPPNDSFKKTGRKSGKVVDNYKEATRIYRLEVCRRRRKRKEIMFSIGKAGKGVKGPVFRRYTNDSKVRC